MWARTIIFTTFRRCYSQIKEMKYLNVAEKPDAAKNISALLSNGTATRREGYSVYNKIFEFNANVKGKDVRMLMTSVSGHLLNFAFTGSYKSWQSCDPQQLFDAPVRKTCIENAEKIKKTLEREVRACQALIIWTDCDREGENIGFEIIEVCKAVKPNISVYRAKFSEITGPAIRRALANLVQPDLRQSQAVDVRSELDLRTGAAFTRFQTLRMQRRFPVQIEDKLISYGSCQIPTLGFVAQRYKEAEAFVSEPFWKLRVTHTIDDLTVEFTWARNRLFDKDACEDFLMLCLAEPQATVDTVTTKPKNKWRPTPLDTVELEKLGSRKLKINAKTVMTIAEKLYTQGLISYPRTETNVFSADINLRSLVEMQAAHPDWGGFAERVMEWGPNPRNGKKLDQAHPPIHPTKFTTGLSGNEQRVYELIVRHFLACVSKDATGSETVVNITVAGEKFSANGLVIYERNYLDVYPYEKWNAKEIHHYEVGQVFEPTDIEMLEGSTTAPPLLTEADLIALMEKHGIGTDATHAEHIDTIKVRGYIGEVDRGMLVPGTIGMGLYEGYEAIELPLAKPFLRAEFESDLKKICLGEKNPTEVLREQIQKYKEAYRIIFERSPALFEKVGLRLNETPQEVTAESESANFNREVFKCPKCQNGAMTLRKKRDSNDYFLGCMCFPECKNSVWFKEGVKEMTVSENHCSRCGPNYKKLEVKFKTNNYLAILNASSNVYETCLGCDSTFRELFEINVDTVKRVGNIVNNQAPRTTNTSNTTRQNSAPNRDRGNNRSNQNSTSSRNTSNPPRRNFSSASNPNTPRDDENLYQISDDFFDDDDDDFGGILANVVQDAERNVNSGGQNSNNSSGRSWSSSNPEREQQPQRNENPNTERNTNGWWPSSGSSPVGRSPGNDSTKRTTGWQSSSNSTTNGPQRNTQPAKTTWESNSNSTRTLAGWLSNSNNTNNASMGRGSSAPRSAQPSTSWGSNNNTSSGRDWWSSGAQRDQPAAASWGTDSNRANTSADWGSATHNWSGIEFHEDPDSNARGSHRNAAISTWGQRQPNNVNVVKCTGCHQVAKELTVKKDGPNKGRTFYSCPKSSQCKFFQWADETASPPANEVRQPRQRSPAPEGSRVVCTKCQLPAKELTVRKEGPTKGRQFYACANASISCGFFQWADENDNSAANQATSSWSSGNTSRTSSRNESESSEPKKRKCGLCRQEGHNRNKCPRRN